MTRLTKIEIHGLKSRDRLVELSGRDAILGDARSGKSTVRHALMFLATGKNPERGDSLADAAALMHGPEMTVTATWSDGSWASRTLRRRGASFTSTAACSFAAEEAKATDVKAAIQARFGATDAEAIQNLSIEAITKLTGNKQAEAVNALLDEDGLGADEVANRLSTLAPLRVVQGGDVALPDNRETWDAVRAGTAAQLFDAQAAAMHSVLSEARTNVETVGISEALKKAKTAKADAQAQAQRRTNARAEIEDRIAGITAPEATLEQLGKDRQDLTDRIAVLRSEVEKHRESASAREAAENALNEAEAYLDEMCQGGDPKAQVAELRQRAQDLRAEASTLIEPAPTPSWDRIEYSDHVDANVDELEADAVKIRAQADAIDIDDEVGEFEQRLQIPTTDYEAARVERAEGGLEKAKNSAWTRVRKIASEIDTESGQGEDFPYAEYTNELRELADANGFPIEAAKSALESVREELKGAEQRCRAVLDQNAAIDARNEARREVRAELETKVARLRASADTLAEEARAKRQAENDRVNAENVKRKRAYDEAYAKRAAAADAVVQKRRLLSDQADQADESATNMERAWTKASRAEAEARALLDGMETVAPLDVDAHELEIVGAQQSIERIDETKRAVEAADARKRELTGITESIIAAEAERDCTAAVAWALAKIQAQDLDARVGPITERMTAFLQGAGLTERPFLEAAGAKVRYGWITGPDHPDLDAGVEIDGLSLSGAERVLFMAAFWYAITDLRRLHTRVLALEIDDLTDHWAEALLKGIDAVGIGNALVCTNRAHPFPETWTQHHMDAQAAEGAAA